MDNRVYVGFIRGRKRIVSRVAGAIVLIGLALALAACELPGSAPAGSAAATGAAGAPAAPNAATVEILAFNHPPLRPVLDQVNALLAPYGNRLSITRYDPVTVEGATFAKNKGVSGHVPLAIFVNGSDILTVNGKKVTFESFPKGQGTGMVADGEWTLADLDAALKQATGQ